MRNFIAIDFETASELRTTPVSIGIVFVKEKEIIPELSFFSLMNPGTTLFNPIAYGKHHISPEMVKDAPSFIDIWNKILKSSVTDFPVVIHTTSTHLSVITQCVQLYNLEQLNIKYLSTMTIAKTLKLPLVKISLKDLAVFYSIEYKDVHNSLEDAEVTAKVALKLFSEKGFKESKFIKSTNPRKPFSSFEYLNQENIEIKYLVDFKVLDAAKKQQKHICISGELHKKDIIFQQISDYGWILQEEITQATDFIIAGICIHGRDLTLIDQINSSGMGIIYIIPEIYLL